MNIAEKRLPQDGRFSIKSTTKDIDVRVSILPTVYGEKIVMRLLDKTGFEYTFYQQADGKIQTTEEDHHGIMWAERTRQDIGVLMMYDGFNFGEFSKDNSFFMCVLH